MQRDRKTGLVTTRWDSFGEFIRVAGALNNIREDANKVNQKFYGCSTTMEAAEFCLNLPEHLLRPARELYNKVDVSFRDREGSAWKPSVAGAYPVVPEYLRGNPMHMRRKMAAPDTRKPVHYAIEVSVSAGVSEREMMQRAAGIAALVMRTSEHRAVKLTLFSCDQMGMDAKHTALEIIPMDCNPPSLSAIVAMFTRQAARALIFSSAYESTGVNSRGYVAWGFDAPSPSRERKLREAMLLEPDAVVMQGGYITDAYEFRTDPVAWVHKQIEKQR